MLPENANPDLPEKQDENAPQVELESAKSASKALAPEETETTAQELQSPVEEDTNTNLASDSSPENSETEEKSSPMAEPSEKEPGQELEHVEKAETETQEKPEKEIQVEAEIKSTSTPDTTASENENAAQSEETPEEVEVAAEEEGSEEEAEPAVSTLVLAPLNEALLPKIKELIADREKKGQILVDATMSDLLQLMEAYAKQEEIAPFVAKVGLVKRSYDARKYKEETPKELKDRFHAALAEFNRKRSTHQAHAEAEKKNNSARKKELLEKLQAVVAAEDANRISEVREIQDEWKRIGHVLREDIEPLYKAYRYQLDKFYKLREMHFELLDYDRKINLQEKERLIKEAENLIPDEEDREKPEVWKEKMDVLAELRQQWKSIGHVPREDFERINNEYRAVVDRFFDVRQGFMESQDILRSEVGEQKQALLVKMEVFKTFVSEKPRDWNDATRALREYQEAWNQLGQAPHSINSELWSKYRDVCNTFFSKKSDFFKSLDKIRAENLARKRELVEKVEALKDSPEIEKAANEIKSLQKEWKTIGPVPERHSNKIWNRFRAACDAFFERRRSKYQSQNSDEKVNLDAKKALIAEVNKLKVDQSNVAASIDVIKSLQAKWKEIGKVPYKEKDKIWEEFRAAIDSFFDGLSLKRGELRELKLKSSIESISNDDDRTRNARGKIARIRRKIAQSQEKVDQYSINVQYIAKGKSGDTLRKRIQDDIEKEKNLIVDLKKQIKILNEAMKKPAEKPAAPVIEKEAKAQTQEASESEEKKEETTETPAETATETPAETPEPQAENAPEENAKSESEESDSKASEVAEEKAPEPETPAADKDQSA